MGQAHLAWIWNSATTEQSNVADGVVRRSKRARRHERLLGREQASDTMDFCRLNCFLDRHRRDDGRDTLGQHRFTGTRRTNHQNVMAAGDRDFDGTLNVTLSFDIAEIDVVGLMGREKFLKIAACRLQHAFVAKERERLA